MRALGALLLAAALAPAPAAPATVPATPVAAVLPPSPPAYGVQLTQAWIPMRDGVRLAVTLYLPAGGKARERFPALLEYLPYRKDDDEALRDFANHPYFARRGYVGARVDIRGFGNSERRTARPGILGAGAAGRGAGHRLARAPALVERQGRHARNLLGRLQLDPDGDAASRRRSRPSSPSPPPRRSSRKTCTTWTASCTSMNSRSPWTSIRAAAARRTFRLDEVGDRPSAWIRHPGRSITMRHQRDGAFWRAPLRPIEDIHDTLLS